MMCELTWRELARRQRNVLGRTQALAHGLSSGSWDWKLSSALWTSLGPGIAVLHSGLPTPEELRWAAVLSCGKDAALSGDAALVELGLKRVTVRVHDVVVRSARHLVKVENPQLVVQPRRVLRPERFLGASAGPPMLTAHAAVLHAAAWAHDDRLAERRLAMTVQQRLTAVPLIRATLEQMPKLPRRALIRTVLDDLELGAHAQSELDFLRFCRRNDLPVPDELQVKVRAGSGVRYLDGRYRKQRVSLEVDGAYHAEVGQWDADALRSLELAVARHGTGEELVRVTQANLRHDEAKVAALFRRLLGMSG